MTAPSTVVDLDDSAAIIDADTRGALQSAALSGAQVRATAAAVSEGALSSVQGLQPRSVVLVAPSGRARRAANLVVASLAPRSSVPLLVTPSTPPWVGPLDVVVVAGDDAGDPALAESIAAGVRRRAEVVVAAPDEGPLRSAAEGRAASLAPRMTVLDRHGLARYVAVFLAVVDAVGGAPVELDPMADLLDVEAARDHPSIEVFRNPAKSIAARVSGRRVVLVGDSAVTTEVARHGSEALLRSGSVVAAAVELSEAVGTLGEFGSLGGASSPSSLVVDPLFHDEHLDGPLPAHPVRVFAVTDEPDRMLLHRRLALLPDVEVLAADAEVPAADSGGDPAGVRGMAAALVVASRLDIAAAYLQLTGGH